MIEALKSKHKNLLEAFGPEDENVKAASYVISTGNEQLAASMMAHLDSFKDKAQALAKRECIAETSKCKPVQVLELSVGLGRTPREYGIGPTTYTPVRTVKWACMPDDRVVAVLPRTKVILAEGLVQGLRDLVARPVQQSEWDDHLEKTMFRAGQK